mmetsp:Transcript_27690/g.60209  ORF Transcript_27690/g.60209 Transcript_27690/m.60209 type:complete len:417 (-) Transcript_27690:1220-2470(-)
MAAPGSPTLSKGVLVQIDGLSSEAGKPLNGAYGLIVAAPGEDPPGPTTNTSSSTTTAAPPASSGVAVRYPVLVYALPRVPKTDDDEQQPTHEIISTPVGTPKSLKSDNLSVLSEQKQKLFQDAARAQCQLAHQRGDHPGALPWYEAYHDRWPDGDGDLGMILTYVELLLNLTKEPKKALEVFDGVRPLCKPGSITMDAAMQDQLTVMYVQICAAAAERIGEAWDEASQIDTSDDDGKKRAVRALAHLLQYASSRNENDLTRENAELLDFQVRVAQRIHDLDPSGNVDNMFNLGAAHCLKGDNLEGCRWYRRALATGRGSPSQRRYHEGNLITAQLQCPGMPLDGYIIVTSDDRTALCIREADKAYCKIVSTRVGFGKGSGSMRIDGKDVEAINFPLPSSPDDPGVFPRSFLDSLME